MGIEAGEDLRAYESDFLNSGTSYHIGTFANFRLSRYLAIQGGLGYQGGEYDSTAQIGDSSALGTYYANLSISNNLNSRFSHSLSFGRQAQRGAFSNFTVTNYVRYQTNWDFIRGLNLNTWASFEDIDESGGLFAQHFHYLTLGASCSLNVSAHISLSISYIFTKRVATTDSNLQTDFLDFTENRISLRIGYAF